ncbi:1,6-anhydro-N-acetylmuramyl-L-alanine amidase AmpD [Aliiglaciecola sp. CAU 1673]|uniref:1,6-anhydro-N-acetylmuramyl-L-alanine amidase AmpD n=1 Tax=Aliiglaciecola sp. CAU 1673 TaxID=3032595 RepID=UPI0023D9C764|nr:1,6-anhydro-N-acetylmuramyl-L-alanine amidase AmpD [Aliiglaciecola sp. CAU 1673]MDF2178414.1 1,6-anhydro-N-acetylmuramyl-L-alanine amidase AmpD [Aliiglaciecola sp. CAU 1673]
MFDAQGIYTAARQRPSPHFNDRPVDESPSLLVVHNISLPPGQFGGADIDALFMGSLDCTRHPFYRELDGLRVSSHFVIYRNGEIVQYVPVSKRAWHAGQSTFQGRGDCNNYSIGIELEGTDELPYSADQYRSLLTITQAIMHTYPKITLSRIVGHCDIAPCRKTDPGVAFDWGWYRGQLRGQALQCQPLPTQT